MIKMTNNDENNIEVLKQLITNGKNNALNSKNDMTEDFSHLISFFDGQVEAYDNILKLIENMTNI